MKLRFILICTLLASYGSMLYAQAPNPLMPMMVHVEGGTFMMGNSNGNDDEKQVH